jgi:hypothetical protein
MKNTKLKKIWTTYKLNDSIKVCIIENAFLIVDNQGLIADLGTVE